MNSSEDDTKEINNLSFNSDFTCFAMATSRGFKIFRLNPTALLQERDFGAPLKIVEMIGRSNLLALVGFP